jgi:hypothetical protein
VQQAKTQPPLILQKDFQSLGREDRLCNPQYNAQGEQINDLQSQEREISSVQPAAGVLVAGAHALPFSRLCTRIVCATTGSHLTICQ